MTLSDSYRRRSPLPDGKELTLFPEDNPAIQQTYLIEQVLSQGGFSIAYLAHPKGGGEKVVLKELYPSSPDNGRIVRDSQGKLVFQSFFGSGEPASVMDSYIAAFRREAELTRRAGAVFLGQDSSSYYGATDTLDVQLCTSSSGNYYLVMETHLGIPFGQIIEAGWQTSDHKGLIRNANLSLILQILQDVAFSVHRLHSQGILHLDIHANNIYISERGPRLLPFLIDYGNAVQLDADGYPPDLHPYSVNPLSAPELYPLSEYNGDLSSGYCPTETTDTYSIAALLFYAVTGKEPRKALQDKKGWTQTSNTLFPSVVFGTFSKELSEFFTVGLSPWQEDRFSADGLYKALVSLETSLRASGGLLRAMNPNTLAAVRLLHEYPLFGSPSADGSIRLLCAGTGDLADAVVRTAFTCQLLDQPLEITVAAPDAEEYRSRLLKDAPSLPRFSNLSPAPEAVYAVFRFETQGLSAGELAAAFSDHRYLVVDLGGSSEQNREFAQSLLTAWPADALPPDTIHYARSEYLAREMPLDLSLHLRKQKGLESGVLHPFGQKSSEESVFHLLLEERALGIHLAYAGAGEDPVLREKATQSFVSSSYNTASSALAALHIPYKLHSLTRLLPQDQHSEEPAALFQTALEDPSIRATLMYLEHRRWNCEKIMDGFQTPDKNTLLRHAFQGENRKAHSETQKFHPCLVESSRSKGLLLTPSSFSDPPAPELDALDRVSLTVHQIAAEIMEKQSPVLASYLHIIGMKAAHVPALVRALQEDVRAFWSGHPPKHDPGEYAPLFLSAGVDIRNELSGVEENLRAARAFHQQTDYKSFDLDILEKIPHLLSRSCSTT